MCNIDIVDNFLISDAAIFNLIRLIFYFIFLTAAYIDSIREILFISVLKN